MTSKQLRIVGLGDYAGYYSYFTYGILEGAIRCGAWFRPIHLFQELNQVKEQIDFFKPHIILAHCIFNRRPHRREDVFQLLVDVKKRWGTKVYYHMGDARSEARYPHDVSTFLDGALVNNLELHKWSDTWHIPCIHWPYMALYQKEILEADDAFKAAVVFTGSLGGEHHEERGEFIRKLARNGVGVKVYPDDVWGNTRFLTAEVSASSGVIIGTQMGGDIHGYVDVRPWQYIGAGALFFHEKHKNISLYFEDRVHYVAFGGVEEFMSLYMMYAQNDRGRKVREKGFAYCQSEHSTLQRMQAIIDFYNEAVAA